MKTHTEIKNNYMLLKYNYILKEDFTINGLSLKKGVEIQVVQYKTRLLLNNPCRTWYEPIEIKGKKKTELLSIVHQITDKERREGIKIK